MHHLTDPAHTDGMTETQTAPAPLTLDDLREGDVLKWTPANRHAHEGTAVVHRRDDGTLYAVDTFWGSGSGNHVLRAFEIATATVEWNKHSFRQADGRRETWSDYAPGDRRIIPSQHGLQATYWLRPDATPDHATMLAKAEERLARAQDELRSAQHRVEFAKRDLDLLNEQTTA